VHPANVRGARRRMRKSDRSLRNHVDLPGLHGPAVVWCDHCVSVRMRFERVLAGDVRRAIGQLRRPPPLQLPNELHVQRQRRLRVRPGQL
jgi:hypothetical protein